jgi:hypothetical protein
VAISPALWAGGNEKEARRLDREIKKISLVAVDLDGRRVVNRLMAQQLGVSREQLVEERKQIGLVYGRLFEAHEMARLEGLGFSQVARQVKQGHYLLEISEQQHANLKEILADARKLNKKIDQELDRLEDAIEDEQAEDTAASYDPSDDSLDADMVDFSPSDIAQAFNQVHNREKYLGNGDPNGLAPSRTGVMGGAPGGGVGSKQGHIRR